MGTRSDTAQISLAKTLATENVGPSHGGRGERGWHHRGHGYAAAVAATVPVVQPLVAEADLDGTEPKAIIVLTPDEPCHADDRICSKQDAQDGLSDLYKRKLPVVN